MPRAQCLLFFHFCIATDATWSMHQPCSSVRRSRWRRRAESKPVHLVADKALQGGEVVGRHRQRRIYLFEAQTGVLRVGIMLGPPLTEPPPAAAEANGKESSGVAV